MNTIGLLIQRSSVFPGDPPSIKRPLCLWNLIEYFHLRRDSYFFLILSRRLVAITAFSQLRFSRVTVIKQRFNISGSVFKWFISYLKNREQRIMIKDTLSEIYTLKYGVPQGSCAGPVVFLGYLSSLYDIIELHSPNVAAYADDTQLYLGFSPSSA